LALIGTLAWTFVLALVPPTRAQVSSAVPLPAPRAADQPRVPVEGTWSFGAIVPRVEGSQPPRLPAFTRSDPPRSFLDVAHASLFGGAYSEAEKAAWRPLALGTFFTDGWLEPYIEPPAGSGGCTP